jgi:hypothetical protein
MRRRVVVVTSLAFGLLASTASAGMTKQACAKANADGQASRLDGKLGDARASFQTCVDPSCPSIVRDDCAQRLSELDRAQPTIVFDVKDGPGNDVGTVSITVDGHALTATSAGLALRIDPGEHAFTFTANDLPPVARSFVVREGEKDRHERIVLGALTAPPPVAAAKPPESGLGTQKVLGLSAAGVGVIGIAVGSIFGVQTFSAVSAQKSDCPSAGNCPHAGPASSEHSTSETDSAVSTVAFIAAGALLAGGAFLFFTAPHPIAARTTGVFVLPSVGPGGGGVSLRVEF